MCACTTALFVAMCVELAPYTCGLYICDKITNMVLSRISFIQETLSLSHIFYIVVCLSEIFICSTQRALELEKEKEALNEIKHQAELQRVRRLKVNANNTAATTANSTQPRSVQPRSTQPRRIHSSSRNAGSRGATTRVRR